jgi:hypothetical protein
MKMLISGSVLMMPSLRVKTAFLVFSTTCIFLTQTPSQVQACSACPSEEIEPTAMEIAADDIRCQVLVSTVRDYGSVEWWREKYPEVDAHTLESLVRFHTLMVELGGFGQKRTENEKFLQLAYATSGLGANHTSPTAHAYRQAVFALENALDEHPAIKQHDDRIAEWQAVRREVAAGQAEVLRKWNEARQVRDALFNEAMQLAMDAYTADTSALRQRAGLGPREKLPDEYQEEYLRIRQKRQDAIKFARETRAKVRDPEYVKQSRLEDGSQAAFDAANARYGEINTAQDAIREEKAATRSRLRNTDPELLKLVAAMEEASRVHLATISAREEVQAAQAFMENAAEIRRELEMDARLVRRDILALYPEKRQILREVADIGGLKNVPESYWNF